MTAGYTPQTHTQWHFDTRFDYFLRMIVAVTASVRTYVVVCVIVSVIDVTEIGFGIDCVAFRWILSDDVAHDADYVIGNVHIIHQFGQGMQRGRR